MLKHTSHYTIRYVQKRSDRVGIAYNPDFVKYESEKRAWCDANPHASPEQYQTAMLALAQRCGI